MNKKKIIEYTDRWTVGGIEAYIMNLIRTIDRDIFDVSILVGQKETDLYDDEIESANCAFQCLLDSVQANPIKRVLYTNQELSKYLRENPQDLIHLHICQGASMRFAKSIKRENEKTKVIVHSHNSDFGAGNRIIKRIGHEIGRMYYNKYVDKRLACSNAAAKWLFTRKDMKNNRVTVLNLMINIVKFEFSKSVRDEMRNAYKISYDEDIYLNIGRMDYQKNQRFLLDIFREIKELKGSSRLIIIGNGALRDELFLYAKKLKIFNSIIYIERTDKVEQFMCMADFFVLPSLFEGNPIAGVEAQASGLPSFFSDAITEQARIIETTHFLSLDEGPDIWAKKILNVSRNDDMRRKDSCTRVKQKGYDMNRQVQELKQLYLDLM